MNGIGTYIVTGDNMPTAAIGNLEALIHYCELLRKQGLDVRIHRLEE